MNEALEIAEVNRRAYMENWRPGKASRLIAEIRERYDTLYHNKYTDGNNEGTKGTPSKDGMEGG